jgi:hypothetical protein
MTCFDKKIKIILLYFLYWESESKREREMNILVKDDVSR